MTTYEEVISAFKTVGTLVFHMRKLGEIMKKTEDDELKLYLDKVIQFLQKLHMDPQNKSKSTPLILIKSTDRSVKSIVAYCNRLIATKKPEWQVLAARHGWKEE